MARILIYCLLTILLELPILALFGYRTPSKLLFCSALNVVTNITLNVFVMNYIPLVLLKIQPTASLLCISEIIVVLSEFAAYALAFGDPGKAFLASLSANLFSFGTGLVITHFL